jgi:hypothetical protein
MTRIGAGKNNKPNPKFAHRWQATGARTWICKFCRTERKTTLMVARTNNASNNAHNTRPEFLLYKHPSKTAFEKASPPCINPNDEQIGLLDLTRFE